MLAMTRGRPTRVPRAAKARRTDLKARHGQKKRLRGRPDADD
jgi:hypothetical protein